MNEGQARVKELQSAGFDDEEIGNWAAQKRNELSTAGFSTEEVDQWFGKAPYRPEPVAAAFTANIREAVKPTSAEGKPKEVKDFLEALDLGFQGSVSSLMMAKPQNKVLAEDAPMASRIASQVGTLAGDLPYMVGGALIGAGGGPIGAAGGAFGLPAGLRATLMDAYEKGEFTTFLDFWDRASGTLIETAKGWITGAATAGVGGVVGGAVAPIASPTIRAGATLTSEIVTMVTVGKALEDEMPNAQDFLDAAVLVGGLKASVGVAGKLRKIYAETGTRPDEVIADISRDPTLYGELISTNIEVPQTYRVRGPDGTVKEIEQIGPRAEPLTPGSLAEAEGKVLDKIHIGGTERQGTPTFDNLYSRLVDQLYPVEKLSKEAGAVTGTAESPYTQFRLAKGNIGRADHFLEYGTYDFNTLKNNGPALKEILSPVEGSLDSFRAYAASRRAIEIEAAGKKSGIDLEAAQRVVDGNSQFAKPFNDLVQYQNRVTKYAKDAGVLSDAAYNAMLNGNKNYVPFFRIMDDGAASGKSLKELKGSMRDIVDPLESVIKNTYTLVNLAERNAARLSLIDLAKKGDIQGIEKIVAERGEPGFDVRAALEEGGLKSVPEGLVDVVKVALRSNSDQSITALRNGTVESWRVPREVAQAINRTDRETSNILFKILAVPARTLRAGAVLSPDFMARNFITDFQAAFINSKGIFSPIDTFRGAKSVLSRDTTFQDFLKSGAANATMISLDHRYIQQNLLKLTEDAGLMTRTWNLVKSPLEALRAVSEVIENATRIGEFKKVLGEARDKASMQEAGFAAREITVDFARMGANIRSMNMIDAFLNAQIQGLDRTIRQFKAEPVGTTARVAVGITLPSILLWWANHDDPRYAELAQWEKDLFWHVMTKDHIFRVRKPFELGIVFGSLPERMMEEFFGTNPEAFKEFHKSVLQAFAPSLVPTVVLPMMEQFANRSTLTSAPLVPSRAEKLLPEYQYNDYTTEAAKALGKLVGSFPGIRNLSVDDESAVGAGARALSTPILVENYVRAWTGGLGTYALQIADLGLRKAGVLPDPVKPASTLADIPVVKSFVVRYPSASAESITSFYDQYHNTKVYFDTWMSRAHEGDLEGTKRIEAAGGPRIFVTLDEFKDTLSQQTQLVQMINKNPDMSPDEKRQLIDSIYYQMIEVAKTGNQAFREMKKVLVPE